MTFTDKDISQMKKCIPHMDCCGVEVESGYLEALLARLEAAERVCAFAQRYVDANNKTIGFWTGEETQEQKESHEAGKRELADVIHDFWYRSKPLEAWRKAAGK